MKDKVPNPHLQTFMSLNIYLTPLDKFMNPNGPWTYEFSPASLVCSICGQSFSLSSSLVNSSVSQIPASAHTCDFLVIFQLPSLCCLLTNWMITCRGLVCFYFQCRNLLLAFLHLALNSIALVMLAITPVFSSLCQTPPSFVQVWHEELEWSPTI